MRFLFFMKNCIYLSFKFVFIFIFKEISGAGTGLYHVLKKNYGNLIEDSHGHADDYVW